MAPSVDKIVEYLPIALILFIFLAVLAVEVFGCQLNELFNGDFNSFFVPGIKVIG
jgi:hypothetical protein